MGSVLHVGVLSFRFWVASNYVKKLSGVTSEKKLNFWLNLYKIGTFLTGTLWGLTLFFMDGADPEAHFIVYGVNIGLASAGLLTLGVLSSVYASFFIPIMGLSTLWLFLQNSSAYTILGFITLLGSMYYLLFIKRHAKHFYQMSVDQEVIKESIQTLKEAQEINEKLKERTDLALEGSNTSVLDWDYVTNDSYISLSWKEMLGIVKDTGDNDFLTWQSRVHKDDLRTVLRKMRQVIAHKEIYFETIHRLRHENGKHIWIVGKARLFYDENGKLTRMIGTQTDISKEKTVQMINERQSQIIEQIQDAIVATDLKGVITSWNKGAESLTAYKSVEVIGKHISMVYPKEDIKVLKKNVKRLTQDGEYHKEIRVMRKNGEIIDVDLSFSILKDEQGNPIGTISVGQDISERKQVQNELLHEKEKLKHQAHHDALTGLPNRALLHEKLIESMKRAQRHDTKVALLFIDLDHFKEINDSLGHDVGDEVLKQVAYKLKNIVRKEDSISRLGGDEFTITLEDLKQGQDASLLAQKIINLLSEPIIFKEHKLYVSSSIGVSVYPDDGDSSLDLLKYADSAMYKAKTEGRNNFQFYSHEMTALAFERVSMERHMRDALKNNEFTVLYQPQMNGITDAIIGMEALIRWRHPTLGLISPANFIPLAEATGLIIEIDAFVMKSAMTQISKYYEQGLNPGVLAMNLTVKQLQQNSFAEIFEALMIETNCQPQWIELEVTEGQIMTKPEEAIKILRKLSNLGINLAIDDFGTGYSSLSYLKKLPINKLKIDQSFVRGLPNDEEDAAIARAVIALAKSLNLQIIAEGVETKEQKNFMVENGCHNIQGYFYSKPISADELENLLQNYNF